MEFLVGLDEFRLVPDRRVSDKCRASREQSDREVECSDEGVAGSVAIFRKEMVSNEPLSIGW